MKVSTSMKNAIKILINWLLPKTKFSILSPHLDEVEIKITEIFSTSTRIPKNIFIPTAEAYEDINYLNFILMSFMIEELFFNINCELFWVWIDWSINIIPKKWKAEATVKVKGIRLAWDKVRGLQAPGSLQIKSISASLWPLG